MPPKKAASAIPEFLRALLAARPELKANIETVYYAVLRFVNSGELYFFPEFTDHGEKHIEAVLFSAVGLIREDSREILSPEDAAALVLAVLVHDSAMHLTPDSFLRLISDGHTPLIPEFDSLSWSDTFDQFFSDAQRWDDRKLFRILGDANETEPKEEISSIVKTHPKASNSDAWSNRYKKFIGEFIRTHHARIAHELMREGFCAFDSKILQLQILPSEVKDIAGLIARSHNQSLRSTFSYLQDKHGGRTESYNIHAVYLMVLLRISDFLQIEPTRVDKTRAEIQRIKSPLSREEWDAHLDVKYVRYDENDTESIYIFANPGSAGTFLKMQTLFNGLQNEMDTSWAVLGEVYSQNKRLCNLGITLRRVRSNILSVEDFVQKQNPSYFPVSAKLHAAGSSLVKLLIKPLYGDNSSFGVRELMQNAVDAVRELNYLIQEKSEYASIPRKVQNADVLITIDRKDGEDWITISDRGVGMTAEIIRDYYLTAGASFRYSDFWEKNFGRKGKSEVLRSGKFGVGALAGFLLGSEMILRTRHFTSSQENGVEFRVSLQDELIQLNRVSEPEIGTTLRIKLDKQASQALRVEPKSWDWYILDEPKVERKIDGKIVEPYEIAPDWRKIRAEDGWRVITPKGFEAIQWSFDEDRISHYGYSIGESLFACNGIIVGTPNDNRRWRGITSTEVRSREMVGFPSVIVYDTEGNLPLNLARTQLEANEGPFWKELMEDVCKDFIAFLLVHGPTELVEIANFQDLRPFPISLHHIWNSRMDHGFYPLFAYREGFGVLTPANCKAIKPKSFLTYLIRRSDRFLVKSYDPSQFQCFRSSGFGISNRNFDEFLWTENEDYSHEKQIQATRAAMLIVDPEATLKYSRLANKQAEGILIKTVEGGVIRYFNSSGFSNLRRINREIRRVKDRNIAAVIETSLSWSQLAESDRILDRLWRRLGIPPTIPFDLNERRERLSKVFENLEEYVRVWESVNMSGWRRNAAYRVSKNRKFRRRKRPK